MDQILAFIVALVAQYPAIASVLLAVGALRLINKPLFAILHNVVDLTPSQKDNEILDKVEKSAAYKFFCVVLDYLGSIKLPQSK